MDSRQQASILRRLKNLEAQAATIHHDSSGDAYASYRGQRISLASSGALGDVVGPGAAVGDDNIVTWDGITGELVQDSGVDITEIANKQPLDSDLTAIAALTTTAYGRSFLELVDAAAARTLAGAAASSHTHAQSDITGLAAALAALQPLDSDLTAIAALTTTAFGRSFLALVDAAAGRTLLSVYSQAQVVAGFQPLDADLTALAAIATTAYGRSLLAAADAAALRTLAALGTAAVQNMTDDQEAALAGSWDPPSSVNRYATESDPRIDIAGVSLPDAILSLEPTLYWTLGSGGTGLTDQSGNGNNGTAQGGVTVGGAAAMTSDGGASTDCDGSNDYFTSSYAPFVADSKRTFIAYVSRDSLSDPHTLWAGSATNRPKFVADTNVPASAYWQTDVSGPDAFNWPAKWPGVTTGLVCVALVHDDLTQVAELFLQGISQGQVAVFTAYGDYNATPGNFQFGAGGSGIEPFNGKVQHVAVYERELSPASILWLATTGMGRMAQRDWGPVTTLPSSGVLYGDRCRYIADATNGVHWSLEYDGVGTYPWKYIGGPPLFAAVTTEESTASDTYVNLATAGPTVTPPLAGDYLVEQGALAFNSTADAGCYMSFSIGAAAAVDGDGIRGLTGDTNMQFSTVRKQLKTGLAASAALASKYRRSSALGTAYGARRYIQITPVRVA